MLISRRPWRVKPHVFYQVLSHNILFEAFLINSHDLTRIHSQYHYGKQEGHRCAERTTQRCIIWRIFFDHMP